MASINDIKLSLATINVRGLNDNKKRKTIYQWIRDKRINISCLQETFATKGVIKKFERDWKGHSFHAPSNSNHSRGVSILVHKNFDFKLINKHYGDDGRRIMVNIETQNKTVCIINAYAPNDLCSRKIFLKKLVTWVNKHSLSNSFTYLAGDFNSNYDCKFLQSSIKNLKLADAWNCVNKDEPCYTFYDTARLGYKSRLDYVFVSNPIASVLKSVKVAKVPKVPDHRAIITEIDCSLERGKGYWIMNTSILKDPKYQEEIIKIINSTCKDYSQLDKQHLWDFCKVRIKEFSIAYCCSLAKLRNKTLNELEMQLHKFESGIELITGEALKHHQHTKQKLSDEYDLLYQQKAIGAQLRSKARWLDEGERNTKYFLSLEKNHQLNNTIFKLENDNGNVISKPNEILNECVNFYKNLYKSDNIPDKNISDYLAKTEIPYKLSDEERQLCDGTVSENECLKAINHMKPNKSPGDDGIPID